MRSAWCDMHDDLRSTPGIRSKIRCLGLWVRAWLSVTTEPVRGSLFGYYAIIHDSDGNLVRKSWPPKRKTWLQRR